MPPSPHIPEGLILYDLIEIQAVQEKRKFDDNIFTTKPNVKHSHCPEGVTELIVVEDEKSMICPSRVHSRYTDVHIDYDFEPDEPTRLRCTVEVEGSFPSSMVL
ncbi:hypothetical protein E4U30_002427 [Claviceps sp. LM220 group G6]|nr:hypothetical protein E4U30_002427 [Claviceps sp. LM220 group G6]